MSSPRTETCPRTGVTFRITAETSWREQSPAPCASIEVSIDNPKCGGLFLECLVEWVRTRFDEFYVSIGDTLRVYNYMTIGKSGVGVLGFEDAHALAAEEGRRWLDRHAEMITDRLPSGAVHLVTWDVWRSHPGFVRAASGLLSLYETDGGFRALVRAELEAYLGRRRLGLESLSSDRVDLLALYLVEELAVYQLQAEMRPTVNIYPGAMPALYPALRDAASAPPALRERHFAYFELRAPERVPLPDAGT